MVIYLSKGQGSEARHLDRIVYSCIEKASLGGVVYFIMYLAKGNPIFASPVNGSRSAQSYGSQSREIAGS